MQNGMRYCSLSERQLTLWTPDPVLRMNEQDISYLLSEIETLRRENTVLRNLLWKHGIVFSDDLLFSMIQNETQTPYHTRDPSASPSPSSPLPPAAQEPVTQQQQRSQDDHRVDCNVLQNAAGAGSSYGTVAAPDQKTAVMDGNSPVVPTHLYHHFMNCLNQTAGCLNLFRSYFKGRSDVFAKRSRPGRNGRAGYYPQCENLWKDFCHRKTGSEVKCSDCQYRKRAELKDFHILAHLRGFREDCTDVVGIYPLKADDTCELLVFDFDNHTDEEEIPARELQKREKELKEEISTFRNICRQSDIPVLVERSRSGKGYHFWIFFEQPVPAKEARRFGNTLLIKGAQEFNLKSFDYYDRMIPNQDTLPVENKSTGERGIGNLVALPLQGQALKNGNSAFLDDRWIPYDNQWEILRSVRKITPEELRNFTERWYQPENFGFYHGTENAGEQREGSGRDISIKSNSRPSGTKPWDQKTVFSRSDISAPLTVRLEDKIYIQTENMAPRMQNALRRTAAYSNPEFYRKFKQGFSTRNIPRIVFCGYDEDGYLCLPRGITGFIEEKLRQAEIQYSIDDRRVSGLALKAEFTGELRSFQKEAAEKMLSYDNGILEAATAFGKTVVGAYLIAKRKVSTLILTHTEKILSQWIEDLNRFLKIAPVTRSSDPANTGKSGDTGKSCQTSGENCIGRFSSKCRNLTGIVDVVTIQSVCRSSDPSMDLDAYGMVIIDECHHCASSTMFDTVSKIRAKYMYGLTATPKRSDGQEGRLFMLLGPVRYRYSAIQQVKQHQIPHFIYPRFSSLSIRKSMRINELYDLLAESRIRNMMIIDDVKECIQNGRTPILLTSRRQHAVYLYTILTEMLTNAFLLVGGGSRRHNSALEEQIKKVPDNEPLVIVAVDKYAGEGFNCPRLDTLMLCLPISWEGNVKQYAGRLHREYCGKQNVVIYDYADIEIPVLEKMYHRRLSTYKSIGYCICSDISSSSLTEIRNIFTDEDYEKSFNEDLKKAKKSVVMLCPIISCHASNSAAVLLLELAARKIEVTIVTSRSPLTGLLKQTTLLKSFADAGIKIVSGNSVHENIMIIEHFTTWYGSKCYLSDSNPNGTAIRLKGEKNADDLQKVIRRKTGCREIENDEFELFPR